MNPINFLDITFWQSFVSNGLATLLGVVIGIPIALGISNYQEKQAEEEHKKKMLGCMLDELLETKTILLSI